MTVGKHVGDIGYAVQQHAESHGYGVVRALVGHGVGRKMHEEPASPQLRHPRGGAAAAGRAWSWRSSR